MVKTVNSMFFTIIKKKFKNASVKIELLYTALKKQEVVTTCAGEERRQPSQIFLPGEPPWTEEPGRLQPMGSQESDTTKPLPPTSFAHNSLLHVWVRGCFSHVWLFLTLWNVASQAPLSRQEYWSGLPCPLPGHLPNPGIKPESPMSPT